MKSLFCLLSCLLLVGCGELSQELLSLKSSVDGEKQWIFVQLSVDEHDIGQPRSYYYYGKVSSSMYEAIASNTLQDGFLFLEQVMYWGNDDLIHEYEDAQYSGDLIFRVADVVKVESIKQAPVAGVGYEQFEGLEPLKTQEASAL